METCSCIILSVMPWRESSSIATLFSRTHGRVGGIAKGIRRPPSGTGALERGQIVDLVLYYRPHRELHTMSQVSVVNGFGATRSDLGKLTVRDTALEIILKTLVVAESHPELFDYTSAFLSHLEHSQSGRTPFPVLWRFITGWSALSGFRINLRECFRCGSGRVLDEGGRLSSEHDGVICTRCAHANGNERSFIPATVLRHVNEEPEKPNAGVSLPPAEELRVTTLFVDYARYHFDIRGELKSIAFLKHLVMMQQRKKETTEKGAPQPALTP
jgi:DNA repair protein RecO (recombination protein O)